MLFIIKPNQPHRSIKTILYVLVVALIISAVATVPSTGRAADVRLLQAAELNSVGHGWVVLDARPVKDWEKGHIPGALSFSWEMYARTDTDGIPYRILPQKELAELLGNIGITHKTPVAVYGDADSSWGGEGWISWMLQFLGHQGTVGLLSGGIQSWKQLGYPLEQDSFVPPTATDEVNRKSYIIRIRSDLNITAEQLLKNRDRLQIVDTRSLGEWVLGRIPGAVHIYWKNFFTGKNKTPVSSEKLKLLLKKKGIDPNKPIVYYCTGGIRSAYVWMVHELSGLPNSVNFEGGIEEWDRKTNRMR